jgi:CRISP-associated protein Cas1
MTSKNFHHNLFSLSALRRAWFRVEESDGCAGIDSVSISRFAENLDSELLRLQKDLLAETYRSLPLLRFFVTKKTGGQRSLNVAAVRDRVAQHAVIAHLEPILEAEFENCSFAYRRGRSVKQALAQIEFLRDSGYTWVVEADIDNYFDSIDHEILFSKLVEVLPDVRINELIRQWIKARIYDGQRLWTIEKGLPQGLPISPFLANLFLDDFDEKLLEGGRKLIRFADDFVILCKSKPKAESALRLSVKLIQELKLSFNEEKTRVTNFSEGFKYLGATFCNSFCLIPSSKSKELETQVEMPRRLFATDAFLSNHHQFNPAIGNALKEALVNNKTDFVIALGDKNMEVNDKPLILSEFPPPALFTLCTLYIHEHGAVLRFENQRLEVVKDDVELLSLPINKIEQIVLFGNSQITSAVMKNCLKRKIPILLFSGQARFLGSIESHDAENALLHRIQFQRAGEIDFVLDTAKRIVAGKIENGRALLQRRQREIQNQVIDKALGQMANSLARLTETNTLEEVCGCEGSASAAYFSGLGACFTEPFSFIRRTRRPPQDPVNTLLSFGYAMLFQNIYALARSRGLSTHVGMLHSISQGHPALCSDLIEEFRAPIVDALVTKIINRKMFSPEDFYYEEYISDEDFEEAEELEEITPKRCCRLTDQARKKFVMQFEQRINTQVQHKAAAIKTTWRGCIDLQIGHYIKVLRGEIPHYKPVEFR